MMEKKTSERLADFLNFVSESQTSHKIYSDKVGNEEKLTQDYLHLLELGGLKYKEREKIATKLSYCRKMRREYKDIVEEIEPLVKFFEDEKNKKVLFALQQILGSIRGKEKYHRERVYLPRILEEGGYYGESNS